MEWAEALTWAASLDYGGFDDWRLPHRFGSYTLLEHQLRSGSPLQINSDGSLRRAAASNTPSQAGPAPS